MKVAGASVQRPEAQLSAAISPRLRGTTFAIPAVIPNPVAPFANGGEGSAFLPRSGGFISPYFLRRWEL